MHWRLCCGSPPKTKGSMKVPHHIVLWQEGKQGCLEWDRQTLSARKRAVQVKGICNSHGEMRGTGFSWFSFFVEVMSDRGQKPSASWVGSTSPKLECLKHVFCVFICWLRWLLSSAFLKLWRHLLKQQSYEVFQDYLSPKQPCDNKEHSKCQVCPFQLCVALAKELKFSKQQSLHLLLETVA